VKNADIIVVLSGDGSGNRILKGAELAREGFAPAVLAANGGSRYSRTDSQLAIEFAVQHGYSRDLFIETNWSAQSTAEEARHTIGMLRSRGVQTVILVTSPWHTARAGRIYRRLAPELTFYLVGSEDPHWRLMDREGRKSFFLECAKTIAGFLGI